MAAPEGFEAGDLVCVTGIFTTAGQLRLQFHPARSRLLRERYREIIVKGAALL